MIVFDDGMLSAEKVKGDAYVLRGHDEGGYGSPYTWSCTASVVGEKAELMGFTSSSQGALTIYHVRAMKAFGAKIGVKKVDFSRISDRIRVVKVDLDK